MVSSFLLLRINYEGEKAGLNRVENGGTLICKDRVKDDQFEFLNGLVFPWAVF